MIHLHQLPKMPDQEYSYSPFCLKMELYLKVMELDYKNDYNLEFNKSPTGKMPYIETNGKKFADSDLIIKFLEKDGAASIDHHLTSEQKSISTAFIRLCEDSLYWRLLYSRWSDRDNVNWKKIFISTSGLPSIMGGIVYPTAKRNVARQLGIHFSTLSKREVYSKANDDIEAIADFLGTKRFLFNDKISLVDIVVFSFLTMLENGSCGQKMAYILNQNDFGFFIDNMKSKFL